MKFKTGFVAVFLCVAALPASVFAQNDSNWSFVQFSGMNGEKLRASAQLTSADGSSLAIICDKLSGDMLSLRFTSRKNIGSSDNLVAVRFDTDPQFRLIKWTHLDNRTASNDDPDYVDAFLRQVGSSEREIRVRALNFKNQPIDTLFVSKSGAESVNKVKEYCGKPAI